MTQCSQIARSSETKLATWIEDGMWDDVIKTVVATFLQATHLVSFLCVTPCRLGVGILFCLARNIVGGAKGTGDND
ncbi:hypothetical protein TNCV_3660941 [Trichonephila clavipes]|nr:hypothetical protein TNCV_3660941 [Trichonephila clavipes]